MFHLSFIRDRLAEHRHERHPPGSQTREAAVAVILRELQPRHPEILFIQRAEKEGDPWSGHMAFPGGHRDPTDDDLKAAARQIQTRKPVDLT